MSEAKQKIIPNLWFDREAEEAAVFYASSFRNSRIGNVTLASGVGFETTGLSEGTVMTVEFKIKGFRFIAINGGPLFKFNPSISFLVACDTKQEVDDIWGKLSKRGSALMELGAYPFSERYGWIQDRYGLSWQIMFTGGRNSLQRITPTLMFVLKQAGNAEQAINHYLSIFQDSAMGEIMRYGKNESPDKEGTIRHASFTVEGQEFAAMDSAIGHNFNFNEAISLMVMCRDQQEIDYYWERLTGGGGEEGVCGWLKDMFGVSWQITPRVLPEMLRDADKFRVKRVTTAFLKMKKLDIAALERAYGGT